MPVLSNAEMSQFVLSKLRRSGTCVMLGLDVGTLKFGLAYSDMYAQLAQPLGIVYKEPEHEIAKVARKIKNIIESRSVSGLVVGWPLNAMGHAGAACNRTGSILQGLMGAGAFPVPLTLFDESHSTQDSAALAQQANSFEPLHNRPQRAMDQMAAALILQKFLDQTHGTSRASIDVPSPSEIAEDRMNERMHQRRMAKIKHEQRWTKIR